VPISLVLLIALLVAALTVAVHAHLLNRQRAAVLGRVVGRGPEGEGAILVLTPEGESPIERLGAWLQRRVPASWYHGEKIADALVQAGFDGSAAPVIYSTLRLASAVIVPLVTLLAAPALGSAQFLLVFAVAVMVGLSAPPAWLAARVRERRARIRRALPDSLDLLVVCVEAGVSLDSAILRVAREMELLHPDLSHELLVINRRVNAGLPRETALHGLWSRTGVDELRGLASSMVQSERWGTSIATVLRVYAETLRRKRKQHAEKRANEASVKMLLPLAVFIFPVLFLVIIGPAGMRLVEMFRALQR
jgi:tight adherence protein C